MVYVVGFIWAALQAAAVHALLLRTREAQLARGEEDYIVATTGTDPSLAAVVTLFFGLAAPFFLYGARGVRGAFEGVALLAATTVGSTVTLIGLTLLMHAR